MRGQVSSKAKSETAQLLPIKAACSLGCQSIRQGPNQMKEETAWTLPPQYGAIVELVKTPGFHPGDCGFDPRWHPHVAVAQLVRAPGCGPGGCGFEFRQSPQMRL